MSDSPGRVVRALAAAAWVALAPAASASDRSWRSEDAAGESPADAEWTRRSFYVEMRDGVPIAVDLYLPPEAAAGAKLPAILRMTRYWRGFRFRVPWRWIGADVPQPLARRFLARGYAWLDVDVRGSGASGGVQRSLWSADEVSDGGQIVDWVVSQPWSNGSVGALGDSYDGTAAELLLSTGRPAVKAVAPRFSLFDGYTDIAMPGGVRLEWFARAWGRFNDAIDRGRVWTAFPWWVPFFISAPRPVDGPDGAHGVTAAYRAHEANFDVALASSQIHFRDDVPPEMGIGADDWSPCCARRAAIEKSGAAVLGVSGWWDGGYAHAAVKRFRTLPNRGGRLLLGPWNHGGDQRPDPLEATRDSEFDDAAELLRFFDFHLKGAANGWDSEPPVTWFTTGENAWKHASAWPPPATVTPFFLAENRELTRAPADARGSDEYLVDHESTTGTSSRWHALGEPTWTEYGDRAAADQHNLVYESAPLPYDVEVTGHPVLHLALRADGTDAVVFAYLEDVEPDGRVGYVGEGQFRAIHRRPRPATEAPYALGVPYHSFRRADARALVPGESAELTFDLLPISHRFRKGHRIRLALAGADRDQFQAPPGVASRWWVERGGGAGSRLELPVIGSD